MTYPQLGETVKYIRQDHEAKKLASGEGIVRAIFLDPRQRPVVNVKDGENTYSIDLAAVNPVDGFEDLYKAKLEEINQVSDEGNAKAKAIVDEYNKRVDEMYDSFLKVE